MATISTTSSITTTSFLQKRPLSISSSSILGLPTMSKLGGRIRCSMEGKPSIEEESKSKMGMLASSSMLGAAIAATMSSPAAMALVDERMSTEGTGLPFGLSNNILGWILLGVFALIWALYFVYASNLDEDEDSATICTSTYYHSYGPLIHISPLQQVDQLTTRGKGKPWSKRRSTPLSASVPPPPPLDLTEDNVRQVLVDARAELGQIFDASVGITGEVELAELDGPFVKISLKGRFWHKRSDVVARLANYLKQRIPEILEVDIEDEKQLDDSPESF